MASKLEKLQAQRAALDAAIKAATRAERRRALAEQRLAISRAVDLAIKAGAGVPEIEAALAALCAQPTTPIATQTVDKTPDAEA